MIKLRKVTKPEFLNSEEIRKIIGQARKDVANGRKPSLPDLWAKDENSRIALHERHHNGKCCYCERKRDIKLERDVEHYRPKQKVDNVPNSRGYWWLAYEWDNLLIACKTCNTIYKKTKFPLLDESTRVISEGDVSGEQTALINPATENPELYLSYYFEYKGGTWMAGIVSAPTDKGKGKITIETIGLDRVELMGSEERAECIPRITGLIDDHTGYCFLIDKAEAVGDADKVEFCKRKIAEIEDDIEKEISPFKTYAGFRRHLIRNNIRTRHLLT